MSEEPATIRKPAPRKRKWIVRTVVYLLVAFAIASVTQCTVLIEAPVHFLIGWFLHACEALPSLAGKWRAVILPLGCMIVATYLTHRLIRWWLREKDSRLSWKPVHTLSATALILLGAGAAITISGVAHQLAWLSSEPLTENRGKRALLTKAVSNARQIMLALETFHEEHGRYPSSFEEVQKEYDLPPEMFRVETRPRGLSEPFIFLRPGPTRPLSLHDPVIISPVFPTDSKIVVGRADCSVTSMPIRQFDRLFRTAAPAPPASDE